MVIKDFVSVVEEFVRVCCVDYLRDSRCEIEYDEHTAKIIVETFDVVE